jgi:hypothetical protein
MDTARRNHIEHIIREKEGAEFVFGELLEILELKREIEAREMDEKARKIFFQTYQIDPPSISEFLKIEDGFRLPMQLREKFYLDSPYAQGYFRKLPIETLLEQGYRRDLDRMLVQEELVKIKCKHFDYGNDDVASSKFIVNNILSDLAHDSSAFTREEKVMFIMIFQDLVLDKTSELEIMYTLTDADCYIPEKFIYPTWSLIMNFRDGYRVTKRGTEEFFSRMFTKNRHTKPQRFLPINYGQVSPGVTVGSKIQPATGNLSFN